MVYDYPYCIITFWTAGQSCDEIHSDMFPLSFAYR